MRIIIKTVKGGPYGLPSFELFGSGATAKLRMIDVRRTAASGTGRNYEGRFGGDMQVWVDGNPVNATPVSTGWEKVVVDDPVETGFPPVGERFGRVEVTPE